MELVDVDVKSGENIAAQCERGLGGSNAIWMEGARCAPGKVVGTCRSQANGTATIYLYDGISSAEIASTEEKCAVTDSVILGKPSDRTFTR